MPTLVSCPSCGTTCNIPDSLVGQQVRCPTCKNPFLGQSPVAVPVQLDVALPSDRAESACPFCGERVLAVAKKCKHCGETIDVALRAAEEASLAARRQPMVFMNAGGGGASSSSSSAAAASGEGRRRYYIAPAPFPHGLYIFLTLITGGLGLTIWFLHCLVDSRPSPYISPPHALSRFFGRRTRAGRSMGEN